MCDRAVESFEYTPRQTTATNAPELPYRFRSAVGDEGSRVEGWRSPTSEFDVWQVAFESHY